MAPSPVRGGVSLDSVPRAALCRFGRAWPGQCLSQATPSASVLALTPCLQVSQPDLSAERVQLNAAGRVESEPKRPRRDGNAQLVISLLEFMQWLPAPVPWPRLHPVRTASGLLISAIGCPVWVGSASSLGAEAVTGLRRRRTTMKVGFLSAADSRIPSTSTSGFRGS